MTEIDRPTDCATIEDAAVICTVSSPVNRGATGELIGVEECVEVRFHGASAPALPVGDGVRLTFQHPELSQPLEADARIKHRRAEGSSCSYGFEFPADPTVKSRLRRILFRNQNRRDALRLWPPLERPIPITLQRDGRAVRAAQGQLLDISISGTGILVKAETEKTFARTEEIVLSLCLPGLKPSLSLRGSIVHRKAQGDRVRYGIQFDRERTPSFAKASELISQYVLDRQLELQLRGK